MVHRHPQRSWRQLQGAQSAHHVLGREIQHYTPQKAHTGLKNVKFCNDIGEFHMKLCLTYHMNNALENSFNRELLEKCSLLFSIHEMQFTYYIYA